jgi:50S ribosomal protein L16 3-hydroxylase
VDRGALADYRPGLDLRILKRFRVEEGWVLEPGDMLYVPPGVGHRGVTVASEADVALTYSIGFRAPSTADLFSTVLSEAMARETPILFSDPGRGAADDAGELSTPDLAALKRFLIAAVESSDPDTWAVAAGEAVTSGGRGRSSRGSVTPASVARRLAEGASVSPVPGARLTWTSLERGRAAVFVNGESRALPREQAFAASFLCGKWVRDAGLRVAANSDLLGLAVDLLRAGVIVLADQAPSRLRPRRRRER